MLHFSLFDSSRVPQPYELQQEEQHGKNDR
jgi:hypothetical protein